MDDKTKKVLGSATVAVASLGFATLPGLGAPTDVAMGLGGSRRVEGESAGGDLLVELILRTGGSRSVEAINRELRQMLSYMPAERFDDLPALVWGIKSLGLSDEAEGEILAHLIDLIASMDFPLDDRLIGRLAEALVSDAEQVLLAEPVAPPDQDEVPARLGSRGVGLYEG
jgi:hypothetical protein